MQGFIRLHWPSYPRLEVVNEGADLGGPPRGAVEGHGGDAGEVVELEAEAERQQVRLAHHELEDVPLPEVTNGGEGGGGGGRRREEEG